MGSISQAQYLEMLRRTERHTGRNPPADPHAVEREGDLHNDIIEDCSAKGWGYLHGAMCRPTHRTEGEPDFVILADRGRVFFIECKSRTGKLSREQQNFIAQSARNQHSIHVVRSMEEYRKVVDQ